MTAIGAQPPPTPPPGSGQPAAPGPPPAPLLPGQTLDVRVLQALSAGRFLIMLDGGRQLVAQSDTALTPGSRIRLQIAANGPDGVVLRLDQPVTARISVPAQRLAALGLPAQPDAALVLAAFEDVGAPLQPQRLLAALAQIRGQTPPGAPTQAGPEAEPPPPATAAADPTDPAESPRSPPRSAPVPAPERPAPTPAAEQRPVSPAPTSGSSATVMGRPTPTMATPIVSAVPSTPAAQTALVPPSATAPNPAPSPPAAAHRATPPQHNAPMPTALPVVADPPSVAASPVPARPALATATAVPIPSRTIATAHALLARADLPATPALISVATRAAEGRLPDLASAVQQLHRAIVAAAPAGTRPQTPVAPPAEPPQAAAPPSHPSPGNPALAVAMAPPVVTATPVATATSGRPTDPVRREVAPLPAPAPTMTRTDDLTLPDAARDGASGVMRALRLAGVTPGPAGPGSEPTLIQRLVVLLRPAGTAPPSTPIATPPTAATAAAPGTPAPVAVPAAALPTPAGPAPLLPLPVQADEARPGAPPAQPATTEVETGSVRVAREQLADQVFKPKELADYDRVVPLPLTAAGLPTPARLAVATRRSGGGHEATFLRVDADLSRLGPVSIRLSGPATGGPIAITLVANGRGGPALADHLPQLVADLRALGLDAAVRVVGDEDAA